MDVKSKIITEIDRQISFFEEKNNNFVVQQPEDVKVSHSILGALDVLNDLKSRVHRLNVEDYLTIPIVKEEILTLRLPASFLTHVLLHIKFILDRRMSDSTPGTGANPDAMPGRIEAGRRIEKFVLELDAKLKTSTRKAEIFISISSASETSLPQTNSSAHP